MTDIRVCAECRLQETHGVHHGQSFPALAAHEFKPIQTIVVFEGEEHELLPPEE